MGHSHPNSLAALKSWPKGVSGNVRGQQRGFMRVLAEARNASPEAMAKAVACMRDEGAPWNARLRAIEIILDRAWGAPDQHLQVAGDNINSITLNIVAPNSAGVAETLTITASDAPRSEPETITVEVMPDDSE